MIIDVQQGNTPGNRKRDAKNPLDKNNNKDKKRKSVVGSYLLNSEDQKMIYCMNKIIPLEDQEKIAKLQHKKSMFTINTNPLRAINLQRTESIF